jgi:hypothetical protein
MGALDSAWIVLAGGRFAAKTPVFWAWILLDFLVRITTFQWVTRLSGKFFLSPFSASHGKRRIGGPGVLAYDNAELFMAQVYSNF